MYVYRDTDTNVNIYEQNKTLELEEIFFSNIDTHLPSNAYM